MRLLGVVVLAAGFAMSSPAVAQKAEDPKVTERQHAMVVVEMGPDGARIEYARVVDMPLPKAREGSWALELVDAGGKVLYAATLPEQGVLRGEFHGDTSENVHLRLESIVVTLRLPIEPKAARVRVLAPARDLPRGDLRAAGLEPNETVEVGSVALPEVLR